MERNIFKDLLIDDIQKNKLSTVTSNAHAEAKELINHLKTYPYIENFGYDYTDFLNAYRNLTDKDYQDIDSIMDTYIPSCRAGLLFEIKRHHGNRKVHMWSPNQKSPFLLKI